MNYRLYIPKQASGVSLVYFDLFNASTSDYSATLLSVVPFVSGEAIVTGVLGVDLFLTRTSAIGTGGTAAVVDSATTTVCSITSNSGSQTPILNGFTARLTPSGGATAGAVLVASSVFTEETSAGAYQPARDLIHPLAPLVIVPNSGVRIVQGTVASVGNIGFNIIFSFGP